VSAPIGAIDLGGTNVRAAIVGADGAIAGFHTQPTVASAGPAAVVAGVVAALDTSLRTAELTRAELQAVGISAPGPLDWLTGIVFEAPNLPGWVDVPLARRLQEALGVPAFLDNDANLAALAEFTYGANRGVRNMVYITVSTGVGGGLILDGELFHGVFGSAGEVGHMTVDFDGPRCACGNIGCVEVLASGPDMAAWVAGQIGAGQPSRLAADARSRELTGRDVVNAAKAGDALAIRALARGGRALGFAIVNLAHILNLELAVVGGGVSNAGDLLFEPIRRTVAAHVLKSTARGLRVEPWSLGENVGLLGAAAGARARLGA